MSLPSTRSPRAGSSALPPSRPRRGSVAVCVSATAEPPAWYQEERKNGGRTPYGSPPRAEASKSRSNSVDRWAVGNSDSEGEDEGSQPKSANSTTISFAPLPPGRPRSNSISIGVASRAHMLTGGVAPGANAGVANPTDQRQMKYAGPQWYTTGTVPPDVYTYKDLQRGLSSIWRKAKKARRGSTASTTSSASAEQALDMERDAKSKGTGIEHIEEAEDEEEAEEEEGDSADEEEARGRSLGLSMGPLRAASVASSSSEGSGESGALSTSATSTGTTDLREGKWEQEADARRVAKGKGKAVAAPSHLA